ncbi:CU044_5270 family protein [Nocardioides glacieisoli]|uniref:CU044_5270 family protein n=1 Tax=Nocardioides glacieisoli TaxID=1168730 RepID=UPI001A911F18|nr:CU044_5270 family protein [Nocardioides glacieisoli]
MTQDLDELRRSHPAPHAITLSPLHRARLGSRVEQGIRRYEARSRLVRGIAAPATVIACATAVAAVAVLALTGDPSAPRPQANREVVTSVAATQVLDGAARRAMTAPTLAVREDQFVYTRSATITNEGRLGEGIALGPVHEREIWLGQDPGAFGWQDDVIREFGQDWPLEPSGPSPAGARRPTYAWLAQLPTDPDALLNVLDREAVPVEGQEQEQATFDLIGSLVSEQLMPPETAAALFRAVTRINGIQVERGVTDALGRPGIGISRSDARFRTRTTWIFDSSTYELRGTRWFFTHADGTPDTLFGATAVLDTAVVDTAGQAPGSQA